MRATHRNHTNPKAYSKLHQILYLDIDKSSKMATKAQMGAEKLQQPLNIFRILKLNASAEGFIQKISGSKLVESWQTGSGLLQGAMIRRTG